MNTQEQAYINGFIKRAAEYGISEKIALDFLNNQNTNKEKNNSNPSFKYNIQDSVGTGGFGSTGGVFTNRPTPAPAPTDKVFTNR